MINSLSEIVIPASPVLRPQPSPEPPTPLTVPDCSPSPSLTPGITTSQSLPILSSEMTPPYSHLYLRTQEIFEQVARNFPPPSTPIRSLKPDDDRSCETWRLGFKSTLRSSNGEQFPRTLQRLLVDGRSVTYVVFSRTGDPYRTHGKFKKVSLAVNIGTLDLAVRATIQLGDKKTRFYAVRERHFYSQLRNIPNILSLIGAIFYTGKRGIRKLALYFPYYPSDLRQLLASSSPSLHQRYAIAEGFLNGLSEIHSRNIVHSDIKPENILVKDEEAVLMDFGLSFARDDEYMRSFICGTYKYLSHDLAKAFANQNPPTDSNDFCKDLWPAGLVLYFLFKDQIHNEEFLAKMSPLLFQDLNPQPPEEFNQHVLQRLCALTEENWLREPTPNTIEHIIYSLMRFNREARMPAGEALHRLRDLRSSAFPVSSSTG